MKKTRTRGGVLGGVGGERERGAGELLAQRAVGEAVQDMLAAHQDLEERAVLARHWVERAHRATVGRRGARAEGVERADGGRGVVDVRQRVEVATVASSGRPKTWGRISSRNSWTGWRSPRFRRAVPVPTIRRLTGFGPPSSRAFDSRNGASCCTARPAWSTSPRSSPRRA